MKPQNKNHRTLVPVDVKWMTSVRPQLPEFCLVLDNLGTKCWQYWWPKESLMSLHESLVCVRVGVWVCVRMCVCGEGGCVCCWLPAVRKLSSDEDTLKRFRWELMWKHSNTHTHKQFESPHQGSDRSELGCYWQQICSVDIFFSPPSHVESELKVSS